MTRSLPPSNPASFSLGINYWPARTAMGWWTMFEAAEVAADFARIATAGFGSVRIFLTWEDFQPSAARVDPLMVARLVATLDLASAAGLSVMPTLFTGHMSGVNWIPAWALGGDAGDARFRVIAGGQVSSRRLRSWYTDSSVLSAQAELARVLAGAVASHPALWAWDLGNESSNCVIPPDKAHARGWLHRMADALRGADPGALVTVGLHMEDLEEDRELGPREAAEVCDFLTMHGYPGYAAFADGPVDERLLPFLASVTRWLGGGAEVVFTELGVPTFQAGTRAGEGRPACKPALVEEHDAAAYVDRALRALHACGSAGAMLWCYADYAEDLFGRAPLDLAPHERSFGLWRADGSPKPAALAALDFAKLSLARCATSALADSAWLDIDAAELEQAPRTELPRLFRRYCEALGRTATPPAVVREPPP